MNRNTKNNTNQSLPYPFIRGTLLAQEKLAYVTRPHWFVFMPCVLMFLAALFAYHYSVTHYSAAFVILAGYTLYQLAAIAIFFVAIYWLAQALIRYCTSEYGITDKRVLMKTGWIQRDSLEIFLSKIEAIHVDQTITGRMLNYGTISIIGTGGTQDYYSYVPDPLEFRKRVQQQADLSENHKE